MVKMPHAAIYDSAERFCCLIAREVGRAGSRKGTVISLNSRMQSCCLFQGFQCLLAKTPGARQDSGRPQWHWDKLRYPSSIGLLTLATDRGSSACAPNQTIGSTAESLAADGFAGTDCVT
ncbi:unnamed protein product [Cladocopium goreaui]|uniref:Uncharacterized protein n=1 Tax=Cladocopium goreaui TaxID=2562237 RepID=A0A9P1BTY5_9DINO|nr:unnamed protein product [Cladocopium goreaui]